MRWLVVLGVEGHKPRRESLGGGDGRPLDLRISELLDLFKL